MRRVFNFGKIDFNGTGRRINKVEVEVILRQLSGNRLEFTASGSVWNSRGTDIVMGGQCLDELMEFKSIKNNPTFKLIHGLWKKYHLNAMNAGTNEQTIAVREWVAKGNTYDYTKACDYLKSIGLYEVEHEGKPYKYGHGWLYHPIPKEDLKVIYELLKSRA